MLGVGGVKEVVEVLQQVLLEVRVRVREGALVCAARAAAGGPDETDTSGQAGSTWFPSQVSWLSKPQRREGSV